MTGEINYCSERSCRYWNPDNTCSYTGDYQCILIEAALEKKYEEVT